MSKKSITSLLIIYKLLLESIYILILNPVFEYSDFTLSLDIYRYLLSWVCFILFIPFFLKIFIIEKPSQIILSIFFIISFIPGFVLMAFKPMETLHCILYLLYIFFLFFFNNIVPPIKLLKIRAKRINDFIFYAIVLVCALSIIYISWRYTGFRVTLNILDVYGLRSEAKEFTLFLPSALLYVFSFSKLLMPVFCIVFLAQNRFIECVISTIITILLFSIDGSKTVIFTLVLAFVIYYFYSKPKKLYLITGMLVISIATLLEWFTIKTFFIANLIIRRVLFVPVMLERYYYDFFSNNELLLYGESKLFSWLSPSPYTLSSRYLIGGLYLGDYDCGANNGLFSDAFMNYGIVGVFVMPFIIILLLRLLDALSKDLDIKILLLIIIRLAFNFISSSLPTVALTHGFLAVCFVCYIIPKADTKPRDL